MHKHPIDGVVGAKPRIPAGGNGGAATKAQLAALSHAYLEARNRAQLARAETSEIALEERKGLLVSRKMVALQCSFLLSAFRQQLLSSSVAIARETAVRCGLEPAAEHALARDLDERFRELLGELVSLPARLMNPAWASQIDGDLLEQVEGKDEPKTPREAAIRAARAERTRAKELAAQRARRAR
jgi:hypothetical protein